MNIGQASKASGISAKMIRYYESITLLPIASRTQSGYREYTDADVHRLQFVRRARDLGFSFVKVRALLRLWGDRRRSSANVKALALDHIGELEAQVRDLKRMIGTLKHLADECGGNDRPECPIIDDLTSHRLVTTPPRKSAAHKGRRAKGAGAGTHHGTR